MQHTFFQTLRRSAAALALVLSTAAAVAQTAGVTLDFLDAEIDSVARTMATLTGRGVVVDPRVKGTLTLQSTQPVTPSQAMGLFAAQLRMQGFALIERDGMALVVPEADAKLQSRSVVASSGRRGGGGARGGMQTRIFRLMHENALTAWVASSPRWTWRRPRMWKSCRCAMPWLLTWHPLPRG